MPQTDVDNGGIQKEIAPDEYREVHVGTVRQRHFYLSDDFPYLESHHDGQSAISQIFRLLNSYPAHQPVLKGNGFLGGGII